MLSAPDEERESTLASLTAETTARNACVERHIICRPTLRAPSAPSARASATRSASSTLMSRKVSGALTQSRDVDAFGFYEFAPALAPEGNIHRTTFRVTTMRLLSARHAAGYVLSNQRCISCPFENENGGDLPAGLFGLIAVTGFILSRHQVSFQAGNSKEEADAADQVLRLLVREGRDEDVTVPEFQKLGALSSHRLHLTESQVVLLFRNVAQAEVGGRKSVRRCSRSCPCEKQDSTSGRRGGGSNRNRRRRNNRTSNKQEKQDESAGENGTADIESQDENL